jgi:sugar O-acyltransferase (sialic acid O-acetyltransferase NeuD family)
MKEKVVIIGGKGTAVVIAEQIYDAQTRFGRDIEVLGFAFDDPAYSAGINGWPVLCGTREAYAKYKDDESVKFVFALYRSDLLEERIALRESLGIPMDRFLSFVHPTAYIAKSARLGQGNIILANCAINCNAVLGNFNTMNTNAMIGHDTVLGNNNFIAAHTCIGSGLVIGNGNFTGLNCSIRNFVQMGDYNLIGMASNVVKNVTDHTTLVGNPAKPLNK